MTGKRDRAAGQVELPEGAQLASYTDAEGMATIEYNHIAFTFLCKELARLQELLTPRSCVRMYLIPGKGLAFDICEKHES